MATPAQAFGYIYPEELPLGSVFKYHDYWAMLVEGKDNYPKRLLKLGGEEAGCLQNLGPGTPKCLGVITPFTWFPAIEDGASASVTERRRAALELTPTGPVIIGEDNQGGAPEFFAFRFDGAIVQGHPIGGIGLLYADWTAELQRTDKPFESLGRLFVVKAAKNR